MSIWYWLLQALGLAGTLAFAWGCVPTAWKTWRAGASIGTPAGLAWNILLACLMFYSYTIIMYGWNPLITACSAIEILAYGVVLWYNYFPRRDFDGLLSRFYSSLWQERPSWSVDSTNSHRYDEQPKWDTPEHRALEAQGNRVIELQVEEALDPKPLKGM